MQQDTLNKAILSPRESDVVDFKGRFDANSLCDWCELLKDVFAFVNSGGGVILFGVSNDGSCAPDSLSGIANLDPAKLTDKIASYTGIQYSAFRISTSKRNGRPIVVLSLDPIGLLLIPTGPGTYSAGGGRQKVAFSKGVAYFRHGAKSEPGTSLDIDSFVNRRLRHIRQSWLKGIGKVVTAPLDSVVSVLVTSPTSESTGSGPGVALISGASVRASADNSALPIRLTNDPGAPAYRLTTPDDTHPYRALEFLRLLNPRLQPHYLKATVHDLKVLCSSLGQNQLVAFCHKPKHGPKQYSQSFADWILGEVSRDRDFLHLARARYRRESRG
jgi:hypothetical protein